MEWSFLFFLNSALLGVGLAMDAFSVSMANGLHDPGMSRKRMCIIAGTFGVFQAVMPMTGWVCVHTIVELFSSFEKFIPWIALALLGYIGGKMLVDGIKGEEAEEAAELSAGALFMQGVATSIDALSVGFTIAEYGWLMALAASGIIAVVTFFLCMAGLRIGKKFGTKLSGKAGWNGYGSMQIFAGWTFRPSDWEREPMILIKDKVARKVLGINGKWASYDDFWNSLNVYKLRTPLEKAYKEGDAAMVKHLRDADEKFNIIRMFYNGELLRMFPYTSPDGKMTWVAPGQKDIDLMLPEKEWNFVRRSMDYLTESVQAGNDNARALQIIDKIVDYQRLRASAVMPSAWRLRCETVYGYLNSMRWPVMLYLTLSLLLAICFSLGMADGRDRLAGYAIIGTMLVHLTVLLALRWIVSGHVPLSSGFETMQFLAWSILLFTLLVLNKFPIIMGFAPLLASFAMLVAMIGSGSPRITPLMPVLQSPLLSVHVMVIMFSYALFALMMLIGVQGLVMHWKGDAVREESFAALSHTLLYPAVFLLTVGIFVGAVWANVSWGCYWSWDPKEVWALITMFVYMAPLHSASLKSFRKPTFFHVYCIVAFLSVLMTYFGVNFFLGGMHSYA